MTNGIDEHWGGPGESGDRVDRIREQWRQARPDLDTTPADVIGRVHRLANALTAELVPVFEQYGLTEAEFDLLASLRRAGEPFERAAGELASHTMVTTGGLTKRVDRLIEKGWVTRTPAGHDARQRIVRLTPGGRELIDDAFAAHVRNERRLLDRLGERDAAALVPILRRWLSLLDN